MLNSERFVNKVINARRIEMLSECVKPSTMSLLLVLLLLSLLIICLACDLYKTKL